MASSFIPGLTTTTTSQQQQGGGNAATTSVMSMDTRKSKNNNKSHGQHGESLTLGSAGSGVRRWAHRLLQRGQSSSASTPATPVGNGSLPGAVANNYSASSAGASNNNDASTSMRFKTLAGLTATAAPPPPLPPKTTRSKPIPPPRTSSCIHPSPAPGNETVRPWPSSSSTAVHQDFIRYGNHPPTETSVTAALMMAQQQAAAEDAHSTLPSSGNVKSVRFGRQQQQQQQQQADEPQRTGPEKDALAEATIGLEMAANLALAFARDVRREKLADPSNEQTGQVQPQQQQSQAAVKPCRPVRSMPADCSPRCHQSAAAVRTTGHQQEVTLSEFYQLLQFVSGHARGLGGSSSNVIVSSDPPLVRPPVSSALNAESTTTTTTTTAASKVPSVSSLTTTPSSLPSSHPLPAGYLTARSFRQSTNNSATAATSRKPPPHDGGDAQRAAPSERNFSASRSHSVEVNYDKCAMECQHGAPSSAAGTASAPPPASCSSHHALKTRSLPRTCHPPTSHGRVEATAGAPVGRHWAEILALITQLLSGADRYTNSLKQPTRESGGGGGGSAGNDPMATTSAMGDASTPPCPTPVKRQQQQRRPAPGASLSDSEEAHLRRRRQASTTSPTPALNNAASSRDQRHYDSLRTPRSSSRASSVAANDRSCETAAGGGHQSYLASLSQRLQIEQYIVKTLTHLTKSEKGVADGTASESDKDATDASGCGYIECWGSPERNGGRSSAAANASNQQQINSSNVGLERALLRLDQRMRADRQPRIYQHHHWRITPAECNALFLCKMSDDDRLSLTTAISDDDDGGGGCGESEGQHHGHQSGTTSPFRKSGAAASFNCTGAVRKAGFLSVKKWLLRKKHQVELARKRGWRGYWVCLKGTTLLFYPCDSREGRHVEAAPKHLIIVDGAIMQPIPEHPQRDFIFCLSTAFGDAYLFQAPCQAELDTWVNSIHSACAAAFARHRGKTGTLHLLQEEILRLERSIESDHKLKHMAELQLSVVSESESRRQIGAQIAAWEENLERLHCEQFRLRCYMASLQHGELPNPKSLLTHVSRSTKHTLNRLGIFTVSSFHAYICARSPSLLNNLLAGRGATRRRAVAAPTLSRSNSLSSRKSQSVAAASSQHSSHHHEGDRQFRVNLPDGQTATVNLKDNMTVEEFLASACGKRGLNAAEHFVRVKKRRDMDNSNHFVPHRTDLIDSYVPSHELVEICGKALYQVELSRNNLEQMWGFSVEAELVENTERQDELCVFVSRVEDRSVAMNHGIIKGDEIMVINGALVGDLDMMYIESVLQEELSLSLMIRSCRADPPDVTCLLRTTDDLIDSLVCPPPPSDQLITDDALSNLIVPAPTWHGQSAQTVDSPGAFPTELPPIQQNKSSPADVTGPVLRPRMSERSSTSTTSDFRRSSPTGSIASSQSIALTPNRQLSDGEKLKKCILELVETERTYVKHLNNLLENYLEPLKQETFLSSAEINALFGNIQEIVTFQRMFQQSLEEALAVEPHFDIIDQPYQFKNVLFAIGSAFLHHANHFKLYSSFCASHSKAQKVLLPNEGSQALQEFLQSRNPRQQHSSTLESYLIKPIQRILKYPLLLQQLRNLTDPNSSEHQHLVDALKGMEKVAEHINEMQRIHEEYGAIFDHLFRQHQKSCKQPVDLSPSELLYYGGVEWLNISDFLGKVKKGLELHAMCFVFKSAVVFLCKERLRQRKKLMSVTTKTSAPEVEIIRYQVLIPVTEVQVRTAQAKDMEAHYLWELIHLKNPLHRRSEKVYHLSNSTAEFRNAFLKTIRQIIRESVRNMSIPPAKPPVPSASTPPTPKAEANKGASKGKRNVQRHSAGTIDYDNVEACGGGEVDDIPTVTFRGRSNTIGEKKSIRRVDSSEARDGDPGVKSENEDDHQHRSKPSLGRTPNHLSLSTTSTLSTGSACSQAKLIQASRTPQSYAPAAAKPLGSPIWKPREGVGESFTLPRPSKSNDMPNSGSNSGNKNSYGTLGNPSKK
ncbi:protein still life, isoforms C/SIF type 2 isoform X7 [Daphnia magna]|uniref:protein still life, isoforms C/SIF type 2 isoform X7 n=1 Tax=Daphnia magna TaxID=35525 RepID=UPI001E1BD714|nr:protein still life, isoforms C/SIF type 2 isoform X7 [Daphnia magna]